MPCRQTVIVLSSRQQLVSSDSRTHILCGNHTFAINEVVAATPPPASPQSMLLAAGACPMRPWGDMVKSTPPRKNRASHLIRNRWSALCTQKNRKHIGRTSPDSRVANAHALYASQGFSRAKAQGFCGRSFPPSSRTDRCRRGRPG